MFRDIADFLQHLQSEQKLAASLTMSPNPELALVPVDRKVAASSSGEV